MVDSVSSVHSRRAYAFALNEFFGWYRAAVRPPFSKAVVQEYRSHLEAQGLAPSTINVRLAAIRKLAAEAADNGLLAPELAAGIGKVKGAKQRGVRAGNWLEQPQARDLLRAPVGSTRRAIRDRAIVGLLLGCALRRGELVALDVEHIQQRVGRWVLPDLKGKGNRVRTVPVLRRNAVQSMHEAHGQAVAALAGNNAEKRAYERMKHGRGRARFKRPGFDAGPQQRYSGPGADA